jgi:CDP-paratose 2-epimerase
MRVAIIGGAGFVGSSLALAFRRESPDDAVVAFDNLKRRGSEWNVERFRKRGIDFVHGDVRNPEDLAALSGTFDLVVDAAAEPSVLAGLDGAPSYVVSTNLVGTTHCLEFVRKRAGAFVFLSTSRVYSIAPLRELQLDELPTRFTIAAAQKEIGVSAVGISEDFCVRLPRSLYGTTKLASELLVQEYAASLGVRAIINRCGVIAGPGQFGKVDQGVFTLWVANHLFGIPLTYTGFGGTGKQVRDLLHPEDLFDAIQLQVSKLERMSGETFNLGGGSQSATSLCELTEHCQRITGRAVPVTASPTSSAVDIPLYVSDTGRAHRMLGWQPKRRVVDIVADIHDWLSRDRARLAPLFGAAE